MTSRWQYRLVFSAVAEGGFLLPAWVCWDPSSHTHTALVGSGRLSFYSGHSSFTMYCMVFLMLSVQARLSWRWVRLLRPTVQFFLVAFALYVGYTRVSDHKHHWSDVLTGHLQGALLASLTIRYISDFFKVRPPQCCLEGDKVEQKPSLSLTMTLGDTDRNHYRCPVSSA
ncbi:phospholipid phosphatase 2-like [Tamandua tetradactyla]|uniref:phospholipid phosphatase 2-like n=1 Tax=Tamandua tetradactyla TaxID=48850 RepID=UPI0040549278